MPRVRKQFQGERFTDKGAARARERELREEGRKVAFTTAESDGELVYYVRDQGE